MNRRRTASLLLAGACTATALVGLTPPARALPGEISTVAGGPGEGQATTLGQRPYDLVAAGPLLYVGDVEHNVVRVLDTRTGVQTVLAGNGHNPGPERARRYPNGDGGPAVNAQFASVHSLARDGAGNLYVLDAFAAVVRKIDAAGVITTVAGSPQGSTCCPRFGGDGGPAVDAELALPQGLAVDGAGNLYISDHGHHRIRKVDTAGTITTFAGDGNESGPLAFPTALAFDAAGNLHVASNQGNAVRRVSPHGVLTTVAGTGADGHSGDGGPATSAQVHAVDIAFDLAGNLYLASDRSGLRRIDAVTGVISTVATGPDWSPGAVGVSVDAAGAVYVSDENTNQVRRLAGSGWTVVAGNGTKRFGGDGGPATKAQLGMPFGVAVDDLGTQFIADRDNDRVRKVTPAGQISTLAQISEPIGIAVDHLGRPHVFAEGSRIYRLDPVSGGRTLIAGGGDKFGDAAEGRPAIEAGIAYNSGGEYGSAMAFDRSGNLYLAASNVDRVYRIDAAGILTTVLKGDDTGSCGYTAPVTEVLSCPTGLAVDGQGNLYVSEYSFRRVRRLSPTGVLTDLSALLPAFKAASLAVDGAGNLFMSDHMGSIVSVLTPTGEYRHVAGDELGVSGDGGPADQAGLFFPVSLTVAGADLYIGDAGNGRIRKVSGAAQRSSSYTVRAWGWNGAGQLGDGTHADRSTATQVPGLGSVEAVAAGQYHSLAVRKGEVWAWGWNATGQLGNGTTVDSAVPVKVPGLRDIVRVAAGLYHSLAVDIVGNVYAWGWNGVGALGDGTTIDRPLPVRIEVPARPDYIAAGLLHSVVQARDGSVWSWGWNALGQLGDGTTTDRHAPVRAAGLSGISYVAAGGHHTLAMTPVTGEVFAWGWNAVGQLGDGTTVDRHVPTRVPLPSAASDLAAGTFHSIAWAGYNRTYAWGWNGVGQLGDGTTTDRHTAITVPGLLGVTEVAAGSYHSLARRVDGTVRAWGWNVLGQLGDGTTVDRHRPVEAVNLRGPVLLSGGALHTLAF